MSTTSEVFEAVRDLLGRDLSEVDNSISWRGPLSDVLFSTHPVPVVIFKREWVALTTTDGHKWQKAEYRLVTIPLASVPKVECRNGEVKIHTKALILVIHPLGDKIEKPKEAPD